MPNLSPMPHQIEGAKFLAAQRVALLADAPRVGKTGAAIMALDNIEAKRVLVVTTASGRPVWVRGFADWSDSDLRTEAVYGKLPADWKSIDRLVVSWSDVAKFAPDLVKERWSVLVLDESHYAKNPTAKRTIAIYGAFRGVARDWGLSDQADRVWCLSGTPIPNAPNDLYPMLRALCPERIEGLRRYEHFLHKYCIVRQKRLNWGGSIDIVVGGRNEAELRERMTGFWLRRTQQDVGITRPIYEVLPVHITPAQRRAVEASVPEAADILAAAETGTTQTLEMHLGTLRRLTGSLKAQGVISVLADEFDCGIDKVVVMCWHRDVMTAIQTWCQESGVGCVRLDGSTPADRRAKYQQQFQEDPTIKVFLGQIIAAGEAIDLSAASELIFAESSFVPKDMTQAALRITNVNQKRQPRVRVAALEGSVDEALQRILVRKVATVKEVLK